MSLFCYLFIICSLMVFKAIEVRILSSKYADHSILKQNDLNYNILGNLAENSSQIGLNNTTPITLVKEGINLVNIVLLFVYLLVMGVFLVFYYLKTNNSTDIYQFLVLLGSGLSNVLTGILLYEVKQSNEFIKIDGLLILIQPLMGLKGNLEMTMASRMSTLMNLREDIVSGKVICQEIADDIILVQTQAIVISMVTAFFAIIGLLLQSIDLISVNTYNAINLCAISLLTACTACFLLGVAISLLIVLFKKMGHDPDDYATPIAASLGDLVTLLTMIGFVFLIANLRSSKEFPVESTIVIIAILLILPTIFTISYKNPTTRPVLIHGWTPIIIATIISSVSGMVFTHSNSRYERLATFQPLFNGFAGNCLAILASRISTSLHRMGPIGTVNAGFTTFVSPYYAFCSKDNKSARTATILLIIVIPSQLLYIILISVLQDSSKFKLTVPFVILYLLFSVIQIGTLLYFAYNLTGFVWKIGYDPDMNVIPILTAMADLSGSLILFFTYYLLEMFSDVNALKF